MAGILVAVLLIAQTACHGCPVTDNSDPTTVLSAALSDRAVTCAPNPGGALHPTKCRPDTTSALPGLLTVRTEAVRNAVPVLQRALHLARSSRKLLLLKSHLLI